MVEVLPPQSNFERSNFRAQTPIDILKEISQSQGAKQEKVTPTIIVSLDDGTENENTNGFVQRKVPSKFGANGHKMPLSLQNSPIDFETQSMEKRPKLEFIHKVNFKSDSNHSRTKSEIFDPLIKEHMDELQNKICLQNRYTHKHRHSINAIFDTFNQKKWIHKRISNDEGNSSPEKSEQSSIYSDSIDSEASIEIKEEDRNAWIKSGRMCDADSIFKLLTHDSHLINCADHIFGYSAMHWAAKKGRCDVIAMLATSGAIIDLRSNSGLTPLHIATQNGKWNAVEILILELDADIRARDNNSLRPLDYLKQTAPFYIRHLIKFGTFPQAKPSEPLCEVEFETQYREKKSKSHKKVGKNAKKFNKQGCSEV